MALLVLFSFDSVLHVTVVIGCYLLLLLLIVICYCCYWLLFVTVVIGRYLPLLLLVVICYCCYWPCFLSAFVSCIFFRKQEWATFFAKPAIQSSSALVVTSSKLQRPVNLFCWPCRIRSPKFPIQVWNIPNIYFHQPSFYYSEQLKDLFSTYFSRKNRRKNQQLANRRW